MAGGPISWLSKKQPIVSLSTSEAEYYCSKFRTNHIDIRYHYIHEAKQEGLIKVHYCPTNKMLADILTKPLSKRRFQEFCEAMGMIQLMEYIQYDN